MAGTEARQGLKNEKIGHVVSTKMQKTIVVEVTRRVPHTLYKRIIGKRSKVRDVPLNATAQSTLSMYLETLPRESTYLFPSEKTRGALTERALGHLITKYARQAHLVSVSTHDLRHRFGYRMAEVVPLHRLAQIMGHNSLGTTMLYIRRTKQDLQKDVEKIAWT